jgi:hypothetical protein
VSGTSRFAAIQVSPMRFDETGHAPHGIIEARGVILVAFGVAGDFVLQLGQQCFIHKIGCGHVTFSSVRNHPYRIKFRLS